MAKAANMAIRDGIDLAPHIATQDIHAFEAFTKWRGKICVDNRKENIIFLSKIGIGLFAERKTELALEPKWITGPSIPLTGLDQQVKRR